MVKVTGAEMPKLDLQKSSRKLKQLELSLVDSVNLGMESGQLEDAQGVVVNVDVEMRTLGGR